MNLAIEKTIERLPNALCASFMEWCIRGGHEVKVKKNNVVISKGNKSGVIYCKKGVIQPDYLMSSYMVERFQLFSHQWVKHGKRFVKELDNAMLSKHREAMQRVNLEKLKVAA